MSEIISQHEFARRVGVKQPSVFKAIKNGRITADERGKINWETESIRWSANRDPSKIRDHNPPPDAQVESVGSSYSKAKAVHETLKAKLLQLEYEQASGKLVEKAALKSALFGFCKEIRDSILNIPDRVSGKVASELIEYMKTVLLRYVAPDRVEAIIQGIDLKSVETIVNGNWDEESRAILEKLSNGPKV